jgi:hypothetical protein
MGKTLEDYWPHIGEMNDNQPVGVEICIRKTRASKGSVGYRADAILSRPIFYRVRYRVDAIFSLIRPISRDRVNIMLAILSLARPVLAESGRELTPSFATYSSA